MNMVGQIVNTKTRDDVDLPGFLSRAETKSNQLFIMTHGRGGSFYSGFTSFLPYIIDSTHNAGFDFLGVSDTGTGLFRLYDTVESAIPDYAAWINFAHDLGYKKIVLGAHSYGPIKITHYYNQVKPKDIIGLFYLAPTDTYGIWKSFVGTKAKEYIEYATEMVKNNMGKKLMPDEAYYNPISAQSYVSLYGNGSKIHIFDFLNPFFDFNILRSIEIPVLTILGGGDKNPKDAVSEQKAEILFKVLKRPSIHVVAEANHTFSGKEGEVGILLKSWLDNL